MLLSGGSDGTGFPLPPLYYVNAFVLCAWDLCIGIVSETVVRPKKIRKAVACLLRYCSTFIVETIDQCFFNCLSLTFCLRVCVLMIVMVLVVVNIWYVFYIIVLFFFCVFVFVLFDIFLVALRHFYIYTFLDCSRVLQRSVVTVLVVYLLLTSFLSITNNTKSTLYSTQNRSRNGKRKKVVCWESTVVVSH